jgi:phosphohistidine phosphatase
MSYTLCVICYFVRHATAAERKQWIGPDDDRPLTAKGRDKAERVAERLEDLELDVDAIVTSPAARAKQTAEIFAEAFGLKSGIVADRRLNSGFDAERFAGIFRDYSHLETLMLVGHEPSLSAVIGDLLGGARLELKKGAVACVDVNDSSKPKGTLLWMASPKILAS